ncbi:glycosyltransferase family 4 protein [Candidatus Parcubacteria bacterium]|nr:glycosyltransferase family 4 protein [Candidatus Parcubacteria bacterium]
MNILLINDWLDISSTGSANSIMGIKNILEKNGHKVYLLSKNKKKPDLFSFFNAWFSINNYFKTKKIIRENKIDVVHINNIARFISPSPILAAKRMRTRVVMTLRNNYYYCPKGWNVDQKYEECEKKYGLSCLFSNCPSQNESCVYLPYHFIKWIKVGFHRYFIKKYVDYFICPSKRMKLVIKKDFNLSEKKIGYLANFTKSANNGDIKIKKNDKQFLYVGRISKEKGIDVAIKSIDYLIKKEGLLNIKLKIIGDGRCKKEMEELVIELGIKENIEFLGRIDNNNIDKYYQQSMAILVPSVWFEVFGLVNIEAMRNKIPVIASNIGGISDIVDHKKTGYLFEAGNYKEMSCFIKKLYKNIELSEELGESGHKKFVTEFSDNGYYKKLMKIYLGN